MVGAFLAAITATGFRLTFRESSTVKFAMYTFIVTLLVALDSPYFMLRTAINRGCDLRRNDRGLAAIKISIYAPWPRDAN